MLTTLKQKGYRLTKSRKELFTALSDYPYTVQELAQRLKKQAVGIDLASIYRGLAVFLQMGLIYSIDFGDGKKRYELVNKIDHHHHAVCNNCGKIENISFKQEGKLINDIGKRINYEIENHSIEIFGLCSNCKN